METPERGFDYKQVPWKTWQAFALFAVIWIVLPTVVILILWALADIVPIAGTLLENSTKGDVQANLIVSGIGDAAGLLAVYWLLRKYKVGWSTLGIRKFSPAQTIVFFVAMIAAFFVLVTVVYAIVSFLYPAFNASQAQSNEFTNAAPSSRPWSFVALVLFPPIIEETVFRGFIFPTLAKRWGGIWGAIVTSILFGIAHWQLNVSIYTLLLSLLLCFMYVRLNSIIPGIFFHMFNNYLAFIALMK